MTQTLRYDAPSRRKDVGSVNLPPVSVLGLGHTACGQRGDPSGLPQDTEHTSIDQTYRWLAAPVRRWPCR